MKMSNPPHPGRYIAEAMDELQIGTRELARALDVAPSTVTRLVAGNAALTPDMAVRLAAVIGSTPEMWLRLQSVWSLAKAEQEIDLGRLTRLYKTDPCAMPG